MSRSQNPDKYRLYIDSVQAPDIDTDFFLKIYREHRGEDPESLREDFCGTFSVCCEWVKKGPKMVAYGLDLDAEPLDWGKRNLLPKLAKGQQARVHILKKNVLDADVPQTDIVVAQNFSFFLFKTRAQLKDYFANCYRSLNSDGVLITDCFGGTACYEPNEEETQYDDYSYFWDQEKFDPVTNEALFYIHFRMKGQRKRLEKAFVYDWRLWTIPELREIMAEVGFKKSFVYWEGTTKSGEGDGVFKVVEKGEDCESWIAYVVGLK